MKQGIYKISMVQHGPGTADETRRHCGRVAIINGHSHVLEDTKDGFLSRSFPDGVVDDQKQRRWHQMLNSPYFRVVPEGMLGVDAAEDMPQPEVKPEEIFDLVGEGGFRKVLEAYGDVLFLDGERLNEQQLNEMRRRIQIGELHLLPRHQ